MPFKPLPALALFAAVALAARAAPLTPAETRMIATVDAEQGRSLTLLEKLVNQNSGSMNLKGVEAVGTMLRAELEPLGFAVTWLPMRDTGRAGHLVARHPGGRRWTRRGATSSPPARRPTRRSTSRG